VAHLLNEGCDVVGISRSTEPPDCMLAYKWFPNDRFRFHQCDVNHDLERIMQVLDDFQPRYVVNFAAQGMVAQSWRHPEHWYQTNVVAMAQWHDRLRTRGYMQKFVQVSTPEVYGTTKGLVAEDTPYNPSTPYAVSKAACDMNLMAFHRAYGFPVAITRAANVCGPGQQLYRIIPRTVLRILSGQKLKLEGGGRAVRSFVHIRDISEGTLRVARHGGSGEVYHFATERSLSIRELVEEICRQLNVSFDHNVEVANPRLGEDAAYLLDCTKARRELHWEPRLTLETAVAETIEWIRRHFEELQLLPAEYVHVA